MSLTLVSAKDSNWLPGVLGALETQGCAVVTDALDPGEVAAIDRALRRVQRRIVDDIGIERLERAGELGVLRLMMKYDPLFLDILANPAMLAVVDATVSETAILHLQNGFVLPSFPADGTPTVFQNSFHMDFRRVLNGYLASINCMMVISPFTPASGGTLVIPGSHQRAQAPREDMVAAAVPVECPPGSLLVFDSTLWHAAGRNVSGRDRLAINHQFVRSYMKQQMDYCRALGDETMRALPPRTQQLLGYWTRVPVTLDDYYKPSADRLYRAGQG